MTFWNALTTSLAGTNLSKKSNNHNYLPLAFNNAKVVTYSTHKHLELLLDKRLSFDEHIQSKMNTYYKMIGIIKKLSVNIPRDTLLRIYKPPDSLRPIVPTGTINNSFRTAKVASNGNHRLCLKSKPYVKCH